MSSLQPVFAPIFWNWNGSVIWIWQTGQHAKDAGLQSWFWCGSFRSSYLAREGSIHDLNCSGTEAGVALGAQCYRGRSGVESGGVEDKSQPVQIWWWWYCWALKHEEDFHTPGLAASCVSIICNPTTRVVIIANVVIKFLWIFFSECMDLWYLFTEELKKHWLSGYMPVTN